MDFNLLLLYRSRHRGALPGSRIQTTFPPPRKKRNKEDGSKMLSGELRLGRRTAREWQKMQVRQLTSPYHMSRSFPLPRLLRHRVEPTECTCQRRKRRSSKEGDLRMLKGESLLNLLSRLKWHRTPVQWVIPHLTDLHHSLLDRHPTPNLPRVNQSPLG